MTNSEKFIIKASILQVMLGLSTAEFATKIGYSRSHIYKVLAGERTASPDMFDSLNTLILFTYGSTMLGLLDSTIDLMENTNVGQLLREGFSCE